MVRQSWGSDFVRTFVHLGLGKVFIGCIIRVRFVWNAGGEEKLLCSRDRRERLLSVLSR